MPNCAILVPDRGISILKKTITYFGNVWNLAFGSILMFVVLALLGSWATQNTDVITILADSTILILVTLAAYAFLLAFLVSDYQKEKWFKTKHVLNLARLAFTPIMAAILYFFG